MRIGTRHLGTALCLLALATTAAWLLRQCGVTPLTAVVLALAIACPAALLYAWWLGRRAMRAVERTGIGRTPKGRGPSARRLS